MTEPRHRLLIDTDPGVDDALAILLAYDHPGTEVVALTTTAGNVGLGHTTRNALKLLEVIGVDTPVFAGAPNPLVREEDDASYVHGRDGFGDIGYPPPARTVQDEHAALAMIRLSREHPGALTFVMLGPLTNLALALSLDPSLPERVPRLVVMGGAVSAHGNLPRLSVEFNFGYDPEAAHVVLSRWPRFELVDWEATLAHGVPFPVFESWLRGSNPRAQFYDDISRQTRAWMQRVHDDGRWHAADALAMAVAVAPEGVEISALRHVAIELDGRQTRGMSIVDWTKRGGQTPQATILERYHQAGFEALLRSALGAP